MQEKENNKDYSLFGINAYCIEKRIDRY